ncbi:putative prolipoprotein diacylglyceryl transferase [Mycoplasma leachii PG50]|uniref:Putative prolipoprotein diacylglyceryl transferase n=1 Tax=Mycoplasma leachii (strain DSM 21131 / NCTC 10133 / N29 / PG50) TaxID=880447 RepID=E4PSL7_MYCLG|nr:prolipoprotein diacylglyceryl transferase family protein [Mycoplasma leachii]ADR24216.1 putative prolipoprotein diacylglyceryl transferase [Mycoplasma leachii PG50]CBV67486.1 Prolipoprotein diacylglyceryl transferase and tran [Mycoplasma leachii 99/014/6]
MSTTYFEWIEKHGDPSLARSFFQLIPAYPIFMFLGISSVIIASIICLKLKAIPLKEFEISIFIIVPFGILGATIFGKVFLPFYQYSNTWYRIFFFWEPGMSLFGSLLFGILAGIAWFLKRSKTTMISLWVYADCIIPNILLGQVIGRWGNFYNHEILGQVVDYNSLYWLPESIKNNLFYFPNFVEFHHLNNPTDLLVNHYNWWDFNSNTWSEVQNFVNHNNQTIKDVLNQKITYHQPLFLYESIANLFLWLIIMFVINNLTRWINHPQPWELCPKAYPGWFNKQYKYLNEEQIINFNSIVPIKYKKVIVNIDNKQNVVLKLSFYQAWNKAFYYYEPDHKKISQLETKIEEYIKVKQKDRLNFKNTKSNCKHQLDLINKKYKFKLDNLNKNSLEYQKIINLKSEEIKKNKELLMINKNNYYQKYGFWNLFFNINVFSKEIEKINNPNQFKVIRSGVLTGCYILGYLIIRIILETFRQNHELFIQNHKAINFIILSVILISGIFIILLTQFISPYKWRQIGWLYEKSY